MCFHTGQIEPFDCRTSTHSCAEALLAGFRQGLLHPVLDSSSTDIHQASTGKFNDLISNFIESPNLQLSSILTAFFAAPLVLIVVHPCEFCVGMYEALLLIILRKSVYTVCPKKK